MTAIMATWDVFRSWEDGMLRHSDPLPSSSMHEARLFQEWRRKSNQHELVESILAVVRGVREALQHLSKVEQSQEKLPEHWDELDVPLMCELYRRMTNYLNVRRALKEHIRAYKHELHQPNPHALSTINARADKFVSDWLRENELEIAHFKIQLGECRSWLIENGQRLSQIIMKEPTPTPSDENDNSKGSQGQRSAHGGAQPNGRGQHRAGGNRDLRSGSADAGARASGGNGGDDDDDDGEDGKDHRRTRGLGNGHYNDEQDSSDDESEDSADRRRRAATRARADRAARRHVNQNRQAGFQDGSRGPDDDAGLPDYIENKDNVTSTPSVSEDLVVDPENPNNTRPSGHRPTTEAEWRVLIDYAADHPEWEGYPVWRARTSPFTGLSGRAVQAVDEIAGRRADRLAQADESGRPKDNYAARNDDPAAMRETRWDVSPHRLSHGSPRRPTISPFTPPDRAPKRSNPDGDHQHSGDYGSPKRNRPSNGPNTTPGRANTRSGPSYPDLDAIADQLASLPQDAQDFFHRAYDDWMQEDDGNTPIDPVIMYRFIERLQYTYKNDDIWSWDDAPLSEYIDRYGRDQWGARMHNFLRESFDRLYEDLEAAGCRPDTRDDFMKLYDRLYAMQCCTPPPPRPPFHESFETMLAKYRAKIAEAEPDRFRSRWRNLIEALERQSNGLGAMNARIHFLEAESDFEASGRLTWPTGTGFYDQSMRELVIPRPAPLPLTAAYSGTEAQTLSFDYPHLKGYWNFDRTLGQGGYGHAGLWVKCRSDGSILDRKVLKENWLSQRHWAMKTYWMDPMEARLPREWWVQGTMTLLPESTNVVRGVQCKLYPQRVMYRIYMEFCPHGDMDALIGRHKRLVHMKDHEGNNLYNRFLIPNVVVWCFFEALIRQACLLHDRKLPGDGDDGDDDGDNDDNEKPPVILHKDVKPLNVFLAPPDPQSWPRIPVPKLGDFGQAMEQNATNVKAPWVKGLGTCRYRPPEMVELENNILTSEIPLQPASDIWSIGMSLLELMDWENWETFGTVDYTRPRTEFPYLSEEAKAFYDEELVRLVEWCLLPFPDERPSAAQLWWDIQAAVNADPTPEDGLGLSMKQRGLRQKDRLFYKEDPHADWAR